MDQKREQKVEGRHEPQMETKKDFFEHEMTFEKGKENQRNYFNTNSNREKIFDTSIKQSNLCDISNLPFQINELVKKNKYFEKENRFLREELKEKETQIANLRQEVYQSILDETENKLYCLKLIEEESDIKAKEIIDRKMGKLYESEEKFLEMTKQIDSLEKELKKERKTNEFLAKNVVELKEYIITAMEEKDLIIHQLKHMIINGSENDRESFNPYERQERIQNYYKSRSREKSKEKSNNFGETKYIYLPSKAEHLYSANKTIKAKIVKNH